MSNKNSAECDTKSECDCDFYSKYWTEIITHTNQDWLESDGESDFNLPLHHNSPSSSFENKKEKSKFSEILLFPENNQANFKNCYKNRSLLQAQTLENSRQFQAELSPELSDCSSKTYSPKIFSYVCDGSCKGNLCLNSKNPLIITEKLDKGPYFYTIKVSDATDKVQQKQPIPDYPPTSVQKKASHISFLCTKNETGADIHCFEQSAVSAKVNKSLDRKSTISYSSERICHKKTTSNQLVNEHLECSSLSPSKSGSPQTAEQTNVHASSEGLTISLTLEAGTIDTIDSLAVDISPSKTRDGKEDSQQNTSAFKFTDSEHKLCISIIPSISYSALLDAESQEQITPFTKQKRLPKTLDDEASQPLTTHTKSPESSSPNFPTDQVPSTLKQWSARQLLLARKAKPIHEAQSSYLFIRSFPYHKVASKAEVQKHPLKAYRPEKYAVFAKNKEVQNDKIFRNRPPIFYKRNWPNTGTVEPFPYQRVKELAINELEYSPLTWSTCHCCPLLDLTADLLSKRKYSGTEKFLKVHRKPHKQVGGDKVIPRFSSQYLLNPRSSFEELQYVFPIRKKNSFKMQSILTSCLGQVKGWNKNENDKGEVCYILENSNAVGNGFFAPCAPADGRHSVTSPLPRTVNSCIHHSAALPPPRERMTSPSPSVQTERETLKLAGLCPNCKCRGISDSPYSGCTVNVVPLPKEGNIVNSLCMEEPNLGATQVACEDLVLKKFSVCPCGNVPQHSLFPSADNSWPGKTKTRASPKINKIASISESNKVNCPKGTCDTVGVCCTNCHHCFPTCFCFQSMNRQGASRNQSTKIQFPLENGFLNKNVKDFEEKSNAVKKADRKNGRIHMGPVTLQEFSPSDIHAVQPSKDCDSTPKYVMYCPKCCSGCQTAVQHHGTSKDNSLSSKQKMLDNCLNRRNVFLMDPGQRTRSQCKCSQEISLFHWDKAEMYKIHRAMLSKREKSNVIQDFSD